MPGPGHRKDRVSGTIRKHLGSELAREVKDPRLMGLTVEGVDLSGDLGLAKVKVRLMVGGDDPQVRKDAMAALARMTPGLRASLGPVLRLRRLPELRFYYDEGADYRARIDAVLEEIRAEDDARAHAPEDPGDGRSADRQGVAGGDSGTDDSSL